MLDSGMWQRPFLADSEEERERRLEGEDFTDAAKWRWVVVGGVVALVAFAILSMKGWPGTGVILVPLGLAMIVFGGMQALLYR